MGILYLLVRIGPSALIGLVIGFLMIVPAGKLQARMGVWEKKRMAAKDRRINAIQEMLSTIKVTKMLHREEYWVKYAQELRKKELDCERTFLIYRHTFELLMVSIPVVQALIAFIFEEVIFENK